MQTESVETFVVVSFLLFFFFLFFLKKQTNKTGRSGSSRAEKRFVSDVLWRLLPAGAWNGLLLRMGRKRRRPAAEAHQHSSLSRQNRFLFGPRRLTRHRQLGNSQLADNGNTQGPPDLANRQQTSQTSLLRTMAHARSQRGSRDRANGVGCYSADTRLL